LTDSIYKELGKERKTLQAEGRLPTWITTPAWQLLKSKYLSDGETDMRTVYRRIAKAAARHLEGYWDVHWFEEMFYDLMWRGWLSPSTPVFNMGTNKGCPVSCSGSYIEDSVYSFYDDRKEVALLSKNGFGTSGYLGDIRPRGSNVSIGGIADGILPVLRGHIQTARDINQGTARRGAWAGYIPIDHRDFWEVCNYVAANPDDANIGWTVTNDFINKLQSGDSDATLRYQRSLELKMVTGKGYFVLIDHVNDLSPDCYKARNLLVKASNLCTEITLVSDKDHTFTCVLSSMNLSKYNEWKDTDAVQIATIFLDCVAQEFIEQGKKIKGLEKAVRFTEKSRALGLGALGFHTYLQDNNIPFESFEAHLINLEIFKNIREQAEIATNKMAETIGEPEWCQGYGRRNSHVLAIAPNLSTALICGSVSQGIEPIYKNIYEQSTPAGIITRINPTLLKVIEAKGLKRKEVLDNLIKTDGSVQDVDWLDDHEKKVFKTAFEIDQHAIIRLAAARQRHIDQAQSINLFFSADEKEEVISSVHQEAFMNPWIKSLYYIRSEAGVKGSTGECVACHA
jgi:ribonucleoside-diphosphate reductase alpha chain